MNETDPNTTPYPKPFELAEFIHWCYETGGDFDEALRVYIEMERANGITLDIHPVDLDKARDAFKREFGGKE